MRISPHMSAQRRPEATPTTTTPTPSHAPSTGALLDSPSATEATRASIASNLPVTRLSANDAIQTVLRYMNSGEDRVEMDLDADEFEKFMAIIEREPEEGVTTETLHPSSINRHRLEYNSMSGRLIITLKNSAAHEAAAGCIRNAMSEGMKGVCGDDFYLLDTGAASRTLYDPNRNMINKDPDGSWCIVKEPDTPQLPDVVLEVAMTDSYLKVKRDAWNWLHCSSNQVKAVIIVDFQKPKEGTPLTELPVEEEVKRAGQWRVILEVWVRDGGKPTTTDWEKWFQPTGKEGKANDSSLPWIKLRGERIVSCHSGVPLRQAHAGCGSDHPASADAAIIAHL